MRNKHSSILTCIVFLALTPLLAQAETISLKCSNLRGNRVQFFDNPTAPADAQRKLVLKEDAITGAELQLIVNKNSIVPLIEIKTFFNAKLLINLTISNVRIIISGTIRRGF